MHEGKALKRKLKAGETCIGTWISFTDPFLTELLCGSGFDFVVIDSEHSPLDIETVQMHIMATKGTHVTPIVRVAWNDPVRIKLVLDAGAGGVMVPMVCSADEARRAVAACMYPPIGIRGFGPRRPSNYGRVAVDAYIQAANEDIVVWPQIEHIDAVNNIEQILAVPRITGVFIGSFDLSGSLGLLGQTRHPKVSAAIETVLSAAKKASVPVGIVSSCKPEAVQEWVSKGMRFFLLGEDVEFLTESSQTILANVKNALLEKTGRETIAKYTSSPRDKTP